MMIRFYGQNKPNIQKQGPRTLLKFSNGNCVAAGAPLVKTLTNPTFWLTLSFGESLDGVAKEDQ